MRSVSAPWFAWSSLAVGGGLLGLALFLPWIHSRERTIWKITYGLELTLWTAMSTINGHVQVYARHSVCDGVFKSLEGCVKWKQMQSLFLGAVVLSLVALGWATVGLIWKKWWIRRIHHYLLGILSLLASSLALTAVALGKSWTDVEVAQIFKLLSTVVQLEMGTGVWLALVGSLVMLLVAVWHVFVETRLSSLK